MEENIQEKEKRHGLAKEALKALQEIEDTQRMENIIKDNKIVFKSGENTYRVRKPTLEEQSEIDNARRKNYLKLVQDDSYLFKDKWIEIYKKKGIDIKGMEQKIKGIEKEVNEALLQLAKTKDAKGIGILKDKILNLRNEQYAISLEKTDLLSYSIEDQIHIFAKSYASYLVLERKEGDKWIKHFKDYEEFQKTNDSDLIGKLFYYFDYLIYRSAEIQNES